MKRPLEGVLVVSVEQAVAAPFCTSRLADSGARVIKIERPEGDFARSYDDAAKGESSYFVWLNRGKESMVLDLSRLEERQQLEALIKKADVLVQNLKPGAFARMGFPIAALRSQFPRLICCSITGYGDAGPLVNRKAYDLLIQAESGLCSITGGPESAARVGISVVDIATGATAHAAILEALIGRSIHGQGAGIQISMFDVMADWLTVPLLNAEAGRPPNRIGLAHPTIAPYGVFAAKDGKEILIAVQNEREWRVFCAEVMKVPALVEDQRFMSNMLRVKHRADIESVVQLTFSALDRTILVERLIVADIAFADLNGMAELSSHPHLRRISVETAGGHIEYPAPAPLFDNHILAGSSVPALGAHNKSIYAELCVTDIQAGRV